MSILTHDDHVEITIIERLRKLKMSGMADALEVQFQDPNADLSSFTERLQKVVDAEWELRHNKKLNKLLKNAGLRYPTADLDESIYDPARKLDADTIERLATCEWIDEGKNLIVTGMTSSGKTYICNALCVSALQKLKTVKYVKANTLMLELEQARLKTTYLEFIKSIAKLDLLVVDDFGLMDLDIDRCRDLFEVIDCRDGRKSTIIISQYPVKNWYDLLPITLMPMLYWPA
ncbi:MAG: ATP-binding protein [Lachnospiraceae bacterium]|nr:ATP-binding protein [Lachnospiraceae bacterium]